MRTWAAAWLVCAACALAPLAAAGADPAASGVAAAGETPRRVLVLVNLPPPHFRAEGSYAGGYGDVAGSAGRRRLVQSLARTHGLTLAAEWPVSALGLDCFVIDVPTSREPADVAAELSRDPRVAWTQPMNNFRGLSDDPLYKLQPAAREWQLDELHALATGRQVRVAIVDSGVQADHPDLLGQVVLHLDLIANEPAVAENHGTAVAGIVAALADNHMGISGIAPQARLLALRACHQTASDTRCDTLALARALDAAIGQGAQVINLSLSGPPDRLIQRLVEAALARGIAVVAAVDNMASSASFPAAIKGVVAVTDRVLAKSTLDASIAPGADVPTTLSGSRWAMVSGSSYAAAHVSGLVALLLEAQARRGAVQAWNSASLVRRADGRIDACASLARAAAACACHCDGTPPLASSTSH